MDSSSTPAGQIIDSLIRYRNWWLIPTFVCTVFSVGYALLGSKSYTSRQTLVVRDDLVGTFYKPGRFDSLDSMKSAQETILEISRRPQVIRAALGKLGAPAMTSQEAWLGDENISKIQGKIQISAPNGAEFGQTEAIVLSVSEKTRDRSGEFIRFLLNEIENSLRDLRSRQFKSMRQELNQAANIASRSYLEAAARLKTFEKKVGVDLSTLISLNDSQAGTNNLQSELGTLNLEQRRAWSSLQDVKKQIEILNDVNGRPDSLQEVPQELLELQPTLADLAKGLNDATLKHSRIRSRFTSSHPSVRAAAFEVEDLKQRFKDKLFRAQASLNSQLENRERKYQELANQINEKKLRLGELSSMRVDYETLKAEVGKKREINGKAQASLAEIESLGGAAENVSLIARIDEPQTDIYADGPSNKMIVFGGMAAGLFIGFGLVMFVVPVNGAMMAPVGNGNGGATDRREGTSPSRNTTESRMEPVNSPPETTRASGSRSISELIQAKNTVSDSPVEPISSREPVTEPIPQAEVPKPEAVTQPEVVPPEIEAAQTPILDSTEKPLAGDLDDEKFAEAIDYEPGEVAHADEPLPQHETAGPSDSESLSAELGDIGHHHDIRSESAMIEDAIKSLSEDDFEMPAYFSDEPNVVASPGPLNPEPVASIQVPAVESPSTEPQVAFPSPTELHVESGETGVDSEAFLEDLKARLVQEAPLIGAVKKQQDAEPNTQDESEESDAVGVDESDHEYMLTEDYVLSESELAKLRIGQSDTGGLVEKVNQLDQNEIIITDEFDVPIETILETEDSLESPSAFENSSVESEPTGLPLNTSIPSSSETTVSGYETEPSTGQTQPDNRPTATTVDLRMLKDQLSGKGQSKKSEPDKKRKKTLSEVLNNPDAEAPSVQESSQIDQSLNDLANSIRDMCKKPGESH